MRRQIATTGLINFVSLATAGAGIAGGGDLAALIGTGLFYSHSRDEERDADSNGMKVGIDNGYDPREAAAIWRAVDGEMGDEERQYRNAFLADHPATPERIANLAKIAQDSPIQTDLIVNRQDYHESMAPFLSRWIGDELNRGYPKQSVILFQRLATADPRSAIYKFALGESYRKRNLAGDAALAAAAYRDSLALVAPPPEAWRGLGLLAMKAGDKNEAKQDFSSYRGAAPDADDKAMIDFYLTQL
jgi:anti-sigma factor RsiW